MPSLSHANRLIVGENEQQILERPVVIHLNPAQPGTRTISRGKDRSNTATFLEQIDSCASGEVNRFASGTALNSRDRYLFPMASARQSA